MNSPEPAVQALSRRLLAHEAGDRRGAGPPAAEDADRAFEKLRVHLSRMLGADGYRVLMARALTLARAEFPRLEGVTVGGDGSLPPFAGEEPAGAEHPAAEHPAAAALLVLAHFLGLLEAFIGPDLTVRLLRGIWPGMAAAAAGDDSDGGGGAPRSGEQQR